MRPSERLRIVNRGAEERPHRDDPVAWKYTATLELTRPPYSSRDPRDYRILVSTGPRTREADARGDLARLVRDVRDFVDDVEVVGRRGVDVRWPEVGRGEWVNWRFLPWCRRW